MILQDAVKWNAPCISLPTNETKNSHSYVFAVVFIRVIRVIRG
jgi:hypothetical protein